MKFKHISLIAVAALLLFSCKETQTPEPEEEIPPIEVEPGDADILSFTLTAKDENYECVIDQDTHTISCYYKNGTSLYPFSAARAEYELSEGAVISPDPAQKALDYRDSDVKLTVTSRDGGKVNEYTVVLVAKMGNPQKPVIMWVDAHANFARFMKKQDVISFFNTLQASGVNGVIVDIKPVQGDVLYDSEFMPRCTTFDGITYENRDYDYLPFFIEEARSRGMRVSASATIMPMGAGGTRRGPAYDDPYWNDMICMEYLPDVGIQDMREGDSHAMFLNPVHPKVHEYMNRLAKEIVTKFDIDSFVLDYCRYLDINSDFSDLSRSEFEKFIGAKVENWPEDIFTFNSSSRSDIKPGKHYNKWVEWRSYVIQDVVTQIRNTVKEARPEMELEYWAASWWPLPHTGQNWASPKKNSTSNYWWAAGTEYYKTGFADQLDIFQLGAYLSTITGIDNNESVEYAIYRAKQVINGDCKLWGTISCTNRKYDLATAIDLCLRETDGCMIFETSHIYNNNRWASIKEGVDRAWEALDVY